MTTGERRVDDDRGRRGLAVAFGEVASAHDVDAHRAEVIRRHRTNRRTRTIGARPGHGFALHRVAAAGAAPLERAGEENCRGRDLGPLPDTFDKALVKRCLECAVRVFRLRQRQRDERDVIALEPGIHPLQAQEAVGQESGRYEQYQRQRDLRHDQHRAGPRAPAIAGRPAIAGSQHSRRVRAGRLQRGNEPEHERAGKCDGDGDGRYCHVEADLFRAGRAVGQHRHEQGDRPSTGQQPGDPAGQAQDQAFGDQLTNEAPASRSERGSDGELALAARGTGEQQAGHVGARDEQHEADRTKQDEQRAAHVADDALAEWLEEDPAAAAGFREPARNVAGDRAQVRGRLRERHSRFEPGDCVEVPDVACFEEFALHVERGQRNRPRREHPRLGASRVIEAVRHDADDGVRHTVQAGALADRLWACAEVLAPELLAEDDHWFVRRRIGRAAERPAVQRRHAEHVEVAGGDDRAGDAHRVVAGRRHGDGVFAVTRECRQRPLSSGYVHEVAGRVVALRRLGATAPDLDYRLGVRVWQRPQEDAVDDAEDGGVGADAKREREDRHDGEAGVLDERPDRVANVVHHRCFSAIPRVRRVTEYATTVEVEGGPEGRQAAQRPRSLERSFTTIDSRRDRASMLPRRPPTATAWF